MSALTRLVDQGRMAPDWAQALEPVARQVEQVQEVLRAESAAGRSWLPDEDRLFRAFERPLGQVRGLLVVMRRSSSVKVARRCSASSSRLRSVGGATWRPSCSCG